jgi:hypothetical protein
MKVKVIPLCKKVKDKVKAHGEIWNAIAWDGERQHLETIMAVHKGGHPYSMWVTPKQARIEKV